MKIHRIAPLRIMGAAILTLLTLTLAAPATFAAPFQNAWSSGGIAVGGAPAFAQLPEASGMRAQSDKPTLSTTDSNACKGYQVPSSTPYVDICSPIYQGKAEGPWDSRVVITGGGFTGDQIQGIYLTSLQGFLALATISCAASPSGCFAFSNNDDPSAFQSWKDPFYEQFDWTFPTDKVKKGGPYSIVVSYKDSHGKTSQKTSDATFTLLSETQPCILVSVEKPTLPSDGRCPASSSAQAFEGKMWVGGTGWLPDLSNTGETETITVQACDGDKQQPCTKETQGVFKTDQFALPAKGQADDPGNDQPGDFLQQVALTTSSSETKTFNIVAHNMLDNSDPSNNANGALHFGDTPEGSYMTLTLTPPPSLSFRVTDHGKVNSTGPKIQMVTGASGDPVEVTGKYWIPSDSNKIQVTFQSNSCNGGPSPTPAPSSTPKPKPTANATPKPAPTATVAKSSLNPAAIQTNPLADSTSGPKSTPPSSALSITASVSQDGKLSASGTLPTVSKATTYYVCAVDQNNSEWAVPAKGSTVASVLRVKVLPPASSKLQKLLLLLGGLFALISLGVFVLTMPRRAAVPQPVGRRQ